MESTITAIALIAGLVVCHLRIRRHAAWRESADGRFYISIGYPLAMIGVYWLACAPTATAWEWALGNAWALAAMVSFVYGFDALNTGPKAQELTSPSKPGWRERLPRPHSRL